MILIILLIHQIFNVVDSTQALVYLVAKSQVTKTIQMVLKTKIAVIREQLMIIRMIL